MIRPGAWLWLACAPPPPSDAERLADALAGRGGCDAIVAADARDTCLMAEAGTDDHACAGISADYWRDECVFQVAERRVAAGDLAGAGAACAEAGEFVEHCRQHLWRDAVDSLFQSGDPAQDVEEIHAAYERLVLLSGEGSRVAKLKGSPNAYKMTMLYYFRHARRPDPAICDRLPEADPADCRGWYDQSLRRPRSEGR